MKFGWKDKTSKIDMEIEEVKKRPPAAETLNYIGDLYVSKGDKGTAVTYYHNAIAKLHFSQREKIIAIYKKIIKISPSDEKAYIGIIDVFAKTGLVFEEVMYLTLLAQLYKSKGDYNNLNSTFRKITEIDPDNEIAVKYFEKGKLDVQVQGPEALKEKLAPEKREIISPEEVVDKVTEMPLVDTLAAEQEPDRGGSSEQALPTVTETTQAPMLTGTVSPVALRRIPMVVSVSRPSKNRLYLYAAVALLLLCVIIVFLIHSSGSRDILPGERGTKLQMKEAAVAQDSETDRYAFNITSLSGKILAEQGLDKGLEAVDLKENRIYSISIRAKKGCLPKALAAKPQEMIFFIDKQGERAKTREIRGLGEMHRTVFKANACRGEDFGPVFVMIYVAHQKNLDYQGVTLLGLEKNTQVIIRWK